MEKAILAAGCFWCTEAIFQELKGVSKVTSGYAGGHMETPSYEDLHSKDTGHAEVIQIEFDPKVISYEDILKVFYYVHDPTTLNRQGDDVGAEYRSLILYTSEQQKEVAERITKDFAPTLWDDPIVTEIKPLEKFWPAEEYHQNFYRNNPEQTYCQLVINPKLQKFRKQFSSMLKD